MAKTNVQLLFGQRLRRLRKSRGLSQEDFAQKAGLDRSYMGGVERGERNISLENICLIADALGIEPAQLFLEWEAPAASPSSSDGKSDRDEQVKQLA